MKTPGPHITRAPKDLKKAIFLGAKIARGREDFGLTQKQLAEKIGISASAMCRIEKGQAEPTGNTLQTIYRELEMNIEDDTRDRLAISESTPRTMQELRLLHLFRKLNSSKKEAFLELLTQ